MRKMNATFANFGQNLKRKHIQAATRNATAGRPPGNRTTPSSPLAETKKLGGGGSCVGAPLRSCLRPLPQYEYGKDGWPLHHSTGSAHAVQTRYV
jgi:hypothetical protein